LGLLNREAIIWSNGSEVNLVHDDHFFLSFISVGTIHLLKWKIELFTNHWTCEHRLRANNIWIIFKLACCQSHITRICNFKTFRKSAYYRFILYKMFPVNKYLFSSRIRNIHFWVCVFNRVLLKVLKFEFFNFVSSKVNCNHDELIFSIAGIWYRTSY